MKKNARKLLVIINIIFIIGVLWALFFPISGTKVKYSNTDLSGDVVALGAITDNRSVKLKFRLTDEKLCGVSLFFGIGGEEEAIAGTIVCTLKDKDTEVFKETISVKELAALNSSSSLTAKRLEVKQDGDAAGEYTLLLEGKDIDADTRIFLYGNKSIENFIQIDDELQNFYTPLYLLEVSETSHPYIWYAVFLCALCAMTSYIIYVNHTLESKEKKLEDK